MRALVSLILALGLATTVAPAVEPAGGQSNDRASVTAWVYFTDKGGDTARRLAAAEQHLTARARARRLRNSAEVVTALDIPVDTRYVAAVRARAVRVRHVSRWLNAVSVELDAERVAQVTTLPFVRSVVPMRAQRSLPLPAPETVVKKSTGPQRAAGVPIDYGKSFKQNSQINTIALHDLGYNGSGVLIGMLDTGFNRIDDHVAFQLMDIMITRDFVHGDSIVWDQPGDMGLGTHGTYTLSAIGGFAAGEVIGPAWGATYALARTEITSTELHIEEDHWVAGAEWAESLGVDIISSSLVYRDGFVDGGDYTWEDLDGNTATTTIAADIAAGLGVLVVNSAGNTGFVSAPQNTLWSAADGDSVLAVGAVDSVGVRASFSSVGPSADGRIKPDVMARGVLVRCASPLSSASFADIGGTSLACPLVAGAAALLLEANRGLTNMQIIDALRATASQAGSPDRLMGWGIIDAGAAFALTASAVPPVGVAGTGRVVLHPAYPNPFNPATTIRYDLPRATHVTVTIHDVRGRLVTTLVDEPQGPGPKRVTWNGTTDAGTRAGSGVYFCRLRTNAEQRARKLLMLK